MNEHRAVVWLDRDGTIVDDPGYLGNPEQLVLLDGAAAAVARLNRAGATVILVTNQSGVGRGLMTLEDVARVHAALAEQLRSAGAHLDDIRVCPHAPADALGPGAEGCDCRKPRPGLVEAARRDLGLADDLPQVTVGDKRADVELGRALGVPSVLVLSGEGRATHDRLRQAGRLEELVDHVAPDLAAAVPWILRQLGLADPPATC